MAQVRTRVATRAEGIGLEGVPFAFLLSCKLEQLGEVHVVDFWMDIGTLYGQRKRPAVNLEPMANYFWRRCGLDGTFKRRDLQETYLLARLCPYVRGVAAQGVFTDARLSRPGRSRRARREESAELEQLLSSLQHARRQQDREMTMRQFHRKSADILGMPRWTPAEVAAYRELSEELFHEARPVLVKRGPIAADVLLKKWQEMTKRIGRRSRPPTDLKLKQTAMNVLSYEARAAVHRCYSCVWNDLIPHLLRRHKLPADSVRYLYLKHLERISRSRTRGAAFHLFHGHIFALHPAMGMLMLTPTGRALVGGCVKAETAEQLRVPFRRLLAALYASLCFYTGRREETRRTKSAVDVGDDGIDGVVGQFLQRRSGRRRTRRRRDD